MLYSVRVGELTQIVVAIVLDLKVCGTCWHLDDQLVTMVSYDKEQQKLPLNITTIHNSVRLHVAHA